MKILIACVSSSTTPDGVTRHAVNLAAALLQRPEIEVHLVVGIWQLAFVRSLLGDLAIRCHLHPAACTKASRARNLWYLNFLPRLAISVHADVVHLAYPAPIRKSRFTCPVITTLHDLYPIDAPHNFGYPRVLLNRLILGQCLSAVDAIACVSSSTLARLKIYSPLYATKALHIANCIRTTSQSPLIPDVRLEHHPFFLTVAQHRRNKNLPLTMEAFRRISLSHPDLLLVLVGNKGPETSSLYKLLEDKQLRTRVILLHGIPDQDLQWCYHHAKLLLATSFIEGFGLPIAEAMLAGCPIVCSDIPAFRELSEYYSRFIPLDHNAASNIADAIQQQMMLPRPAPQALLHLSPSSVVDQCIRLYRNLLAHKSNSRETLTLQSHKEAAL